MTEIIALCGSLRRGSLNRMLLEAAGTLVPADGRLELAMLDGIPLYNGDDEDAHGLPPTVARLQDLIAGADGLLIATPEYNNSIPGVLKNALDWLSRPPQKGHRVFGGKPVAVVGATPGGMGTALAQAAWLPVLRTLGTRPWFEQSLYVSRANRLFDESGSLTDEDLRVRLQSWLAGFFQFARDQGGQR